jgi:hypothetical protein
VRNNKKNFEENFVRDSGRKNRRERKCKKIALSILPLHVAFFFSSFNKKFILHFF